MVPGKGEGYTVEFLALVQLNQVPLMRVTVTDNSCVINLGKAIAEYFPEIEKVNDFDHQLTNFFEVNDFQIICF